MDELRIAEDRVLKIIEPMHKHQHLLARRRMHQAAEIAIACGRSLYSALSVTKSVAGSPGS
jgi:hypothetical protein